MLCKGRSEGKREISHSHYHKNCFQDVSMGKEVGQAERIFIVNVTFQTGLRFGKHDVFQNYLNNFLSHQKNMSVKCIPC